MTFIEKKSIQALFVVLAEADLSASAGKEEELKRKWNLARKVPQEELLEESYSV